VLDLQGLTLRGGARRRKSLKDNNLQRKDRNAEQEDKHHGKGLCDVCHNDLCHSFDFDSLRTRRRARVILIWIDSRCAAIILRLLRSMARARECVSMLRGIFVIVSARCASVADSIFVSKDLADNVIKSLVCFEALLRDFVAVSLHGEVRELQLISVIERILCAEVVFAALIGEVFFVCIHVFNVSELW
jgi:hypothetical protein